MQTTRTIRRRAAQALATTVSLAALCGGVAVISSATPAGADPATSIGSMSCDAITGTGATLDLSAATPYPVYSYFLVSVDGGAWQATNWFYEADGTYMSYNGTWSYTIPEQTLESTVGGSHSVVAYEVTYLTATHGTEYYLNSCQTGQYDIIGGGGPDGDGITITGLGHTQTAKLRLGATHHARKAPKFVHSLAVAEAQGRLVPVAK